MKPLILKVVVSHECVLQLLRVPVVTLNRSRQVPAGQLTT